MIYIMESEMIAKIQSHNVPILIWKVYSCNINQKYFWNRKNTNFLMVGKILELKSGTIVLTK